MSQRYVIHLPVVATDLPAAQRLARVIGRRMLVLPMTDPGETTVPRRTSSACATGSSATCGCPAAGAAYCATATTATALGGCVDEGCEAGDRRSGRSTMEPGSAASRVITRRTCPPLTEATPRCLREARQPGDPASGQVANRPQFWKRAPFGMNFAVELPVTTRRRPVGPGRSWSAAEARGRAC